MIVNCDLKNIEWVVALHLCQDPTGIEEWLGGLDMHTLNQETFGFPNRTIAKIFLFRLIYGGSCWSYALDPDYNWISKSPKFWQKKIDAFYGKYKYLGRWHDELVRTVSLEGGLIMPTGRMYEFEPEHKRGEWALPRTKILNYPVQGFASDLVKIARVLVRRGLIAKSFTGLFTASVHDSLVIDTPEKEVDKVCEFLYNICTVEIVDAYKRFFKKEFDLPIRCEIGYGPNQKDLAEWSPSGATH